MLHIVKLYKDTGAREDWETVLDFIVDLPEGTDTDAYAGQIEDEFKAGIPEGSDYYDDYWVVVVTAETPDNTGPVGEQIMTKLREHLITYHGVSEDELA